MVDQFKPFEVEFVIHELAFPLSDNNASPSEDGQMLAGNGLFQTHFHENLGYRYVCLVVNESDDVLPEFVVDRPENQRCFFDAVVVQGWCVGWQLVRFR